MTADKNTFRPSVEPLEDRVLLSTGLTGLRLRRPKPKVRCVVRNGHRICRRIVIHPAPMVAPVAPPVTAPVAPAPVAVAAPPVAAPAPIVPTPIAPAPVEPPPAPAPQPTPDAIPEAALYEITITGIADGVLFQRTGNLLVTPTATTETTNGINARDVVFMSGNPSASPEVGAIWFATNRLLFAPAGDLYASSRIDLAYVATDLRTGSMTINPDQNLAASAGFNHFNTRTGLLEQVYQVRSGTIELQFQDGGQQLSGTVSLLGTGYIHYANTPYYAEITGTRIR